MSVMIKKSQDVSILNINDYNITLIRLIIERNIFSKFIQYAHNTVKKFFNSENLEKFPKVRGVADVISDEILISI